MIAVDHAASELDVSVKKSSGVALMVAAITARFDREFGPVIKRQITGELHQTRGWPDVRLGHWPIDPDAALTATLEERTSQTVSGFTSATSVVVCNVDHQWGILRHPTGCWPDRAWPNLSVDYTAGHFADVASVGDEWREAAIIACRNLWPTNIFQQDDLSEYEFASPRFPTFVLPNAAIEILADYRRMKVPVG